MPKIVEKNYSKSVLHYDYSIDISRKENGRFDVKVKCPKTGTVIQSDEDFKFVNRAVIAGKNIVHTRFGVPVKKTAVRNYQKYSKKK